MLRLMTVWSPAMLFELLLPAAAFSLLMYIIYLFASLSITAFYFTFLDSVYVLFISAVFFYVLPSW